MRSSWHFVVYLLLLKIYIYNEDNYKDINILGTRYFVLKYSIITPEITTLPIPLISKAGGIVKYIAPIFKLQPIT